MNVRTLCLGYLSLQDATGYEIKKEVEDGLFSHFIEASYGSIYPALNHLAQEGFVTFREEEQTGKPDKKIYAITETGKRALCESLSALPARDKYKSEFLFVMLLQDHLSWAQKIVAMEKQLGDLRHDLAKIEECRASGNCRGPEEFVMGYGEAVIKAAAKYLEEQISTLRPHVPYAAE